LSAIRGYQILIDRYLRLVSVSADLFEVGEAIVTPARFAAVG
jgi:hypothetical protein